MATVNINRTDTTVQTLGGEAVLSPEILDQIIRHVLSALEERNELEQRAQAERNVTGGVRDELENAYG